MSQELFVLLVAFGFYIVTWTFFYGGYRAGLQEAKYNPRHWQPEVLKAVFGKGERGEKYLHNP